MGRFYDTSAWKKARRLQLAIEPWCRYCRKVNRLVVATEVDHITPMSNGGAALDQDNLQSLCHNCHSNKTGREQHGLKITQRGCDENGMPLDPNHPWHRVDRGRGKS